MCFRIPISNLKIVKLKLYYGIPILELILGFKIALLNTHSIIFVNLKKCSRILFQILQLYYRMSIQYNCIT